jgi:hypothetical protein
MARTPETSSNFSTERVKWTCCGAKYPRREMVFFTQATLLYAVTLAAIANLSFGNRDDITLWASLLASAIGYMLPAPSFGSRKTGESSPLQSKESCYREPEAMASI